MPDPTRRPGQRAESNSVSNSIGHVTGGTAVQARGSIGSVHVDNRTVYLHAGAGRLRLPPPPWLVDRVDQYAAIWAEIENGRDGVSVLVFTGGHGSGKSTLGVSALHDVLSQTPDRLPGGLRRVDLTLSLDLVVADLLTDLGVYREDMPVTLAERCALFRSVTEQRGAMGLLLDDAPSVGAVRALLPAARGSIVVVTAPRELDAFDPEDPVVRAVGARPIRHVPMSPLTPAEGRALLKVRTAHRGGTAPPPEALDDLALRSGGNPLILTLYASAPHGQENDGREDGEVTVGEAIGSSYDALPRQLRDLLRYLAIHPAGDFSAEVAATAPGLPGEQAAELLEALADRHLVERARAVAGGEARYRLRPSVRYWLHERSTREDGPGRRAELATRIHDFYLERARAAHRLLLPRRWLVQPDDPESVTPFPDENEARTWLERERRTLTQVVWHAHSIERHRTVWRLCEVLWPLYFLGSHYADWIATHRVAVRSAAHPDDGDPVALSRMRVQFARPFLERGHLDRAATEAEEGLRVAREAGHILALLTALEATADVRAAQGDREPARRHLTEALTLAESSGDPRAVVVERHKLARLDLADGRLDDARRALERVWAEVTALPTRDLYNEARVLTSLGELELRSDDPSAALERYGEAVALLRQKQSDRRLADVLVLRANVFERTDDAAAAARDLREAWDIYTRIDSPRAGEIGDRLAAAGQR